ncbi:hypothetical protein [Dongia rigui]|uniref:Glycoside hydrolase family 5 domain-containing protein n=1 Tax=Dongia rigui TaxID=940149 RepID=A0ABU5DUE3_9PROT|nr:hypothetical protein [Dongia rigui]MDY0870932.1 hypothetical protein [Dongia rigui]
MSDGNHIRRGILPALGLFLCLTTSGSALASGAEAGTTIGIATANIAWEKPQDIQRSFTEIADAGFTTVRIGLKNPVAASYAALTAAKEAGLDILVTVPLIDGSVALEGAAPRARSKRFFKAFGLSQIDPARVEARLADLLDFVAARDIPLIGLELGNELNWSGYNGDLPLLATGQVVVSHQDLAPDVAKRFAAGIAKYRSVFEIAKAALEARPALGNVKLVSAGLADINADFIRRSGATYIAPALVYDAYADQRVFALTDVVGVHLYEPLRAASRSAERPAMIDAQLRNCGATAFSGRPCWITEFGSALPPQTCAPEDAQRISLLQPLLEHLAQPGRATAVPFAFYYDWDADKGFALKRCGQPTALVETLSRAESAGQP